MSELSGMKINGLQRFMEWYSDNDLNRNGLLERAELYDADFLLYDKDNNGSVTREEVIIAEGAHFRELLGISQFSMSGKSLIVVLSKDQAIQGVAFMSGTSILFSYDGKIELAILSNDHIIQGNAFMSGTNILFTKEGVIEYATLSGDHIIQGNAFMSGTKVMFSKDGKVEAAKLSTDQTIQGKRFKAGTVVGFDKTGKIIN